MQVLLRITEHFNGQEYGLEKRFTTEQIDQAIADILHIEYDLMKATIQFDLDVAKAKLEKDA